MSNDPYDMSEMVMPLQEYIEDSVAHEIIHNGATFQVAWWSRSLGHSSLHLCSSNLICGSIYPTTIELNTWLLSFKGCRIDKQLLYSRVTWSSPMCAKAHSSRWSSASSGKGNTIKVLLRALCLWSSLYLVFKAEVLSAMFWMVLCQCPFFSHHPFFAKWPW